METFVSNFKIPFRAHKQDDNTPSNNVSLFRDIVKRVTVYNEARYQRNGGIVRR